MQSLNAKVGVTTHWDVYRERIKGVDNRLKHLQSVGKVQLLPEHKHTTWSDGSNLSKSDRRGRKSEQLYMERHVICERVKVSIYLDRFSRPCLLLSCSEKCSEFEAPRMRPSPVPLDRSSLFHNDVSCKDGKQLEVFCGRDATRTVTVATYVI